MRVGNLRCMGDVAGGVYKRIFTKDMSQTDIYTKCLLHFDGADAATTTYEETGRTVTVAGTAQLDTAQKKFNVSSLLLDGNSDYITVPDSNDWSFSKDLTIECWIRYSALPSGGTAYTICSQYVNNDNYWAIYLGADSKLYWQVRVGGSLVHNRVYDSSSALSINNWHHVAFQKWIDTTVRVYVNGVVMTGSGFPDCSTSAWGHIAATLDIGRGLNDANYYFGGWIDEFRISNGICRFPVDGFSIPTSAYELTDNVADSYTKLLIHGDGIDASTTFYDNSVFGKTITANGTAQIDTAQYKFGVSSVLLDGNSDYLTLVDSADWYFGTGNFTIDCWVRFPSTAGIQPIISQCEDANNYWWFIKDATHYLKFEAKDDGNWKAQYRTSSAWSVAADTWYHLTLVRNGTSILIFIDGVSQPMTEVNAIGTNDLGNMAAVLQVGKDDTNYFGGYIDELRVSKGIARWTSTFTPPTSAYSSSLTSIPIVGLTGDTNKEYILRCKFINGYNGAITLYLKPNNDGGANYGCQQIQGSNATVSAARATGTSSGMYLGGIGALNNFNYDEMILYAKSGTIRLGINTFMNNTTGTTVESIFLRSEVWKDTSNEITSLVILADNANAIGPGSLIELFALKEKS